MTGFKTVCTAFLRRIGAIDRTLKELALKELASRMCLCVVFLVVVSDLEHLKCSAPVWDLRSFVHLELRRVPFIYVVHLWQ